MEISSSSLPSIPLISSTPPSSCTTAASATKRHTMDASHFVRALFWQDEKSRLLSRKTKGKGGPEAEVELAGTSLTLSAILFVGLLFLLLSRLELSDTA